MTEQEQEFEFEAQALKLKRTRAAQQAAPALQPSTELAAPRTAEHDPVKAQALLDAARNAGHTGFIGQVAEPLGELALHGAAGVARGTAGLIGGAVGAMLPGETAAGGAATAAGLVGDAQAHTAGGKALTHGADWAMGKLGRGFEWLGEKGAQATQGLADLAKHGGHPDVSHALDVASPYVGAVTGGAASVLLPAGALRAAQMPFKTGMGPADLAKQAAFDAPASMGPPLRSDPTLNIGTATTEATPAMIRPNGARLPPVSATDMAGRTDPGLNLGADPLGAPSAAAQPPLMADTRPSMSLLDRALQSDTATFLAKAADKAMGGGVKDPGAAVRTESYRELMGVGYKFIPSHMNSTLLNNTLESGAGKAPLKQQLIIGNQAVTQELAARGARLPIGEKLTMESLKDARYQIEEPYRRVAALSPTAASALEDLKITREHAVDAWKDYKQGSGGSRTENKARAKALDADADVLESMIHEEATRLGQPDLMQELRAARVASAQNRDIQRAFNPATGEVDARELGRMWAKDKGQKMTGEVATIGKYANLVGSEMARPAAGTPTPGVGKTHVYASAVLGYGGHAVFGPMGGIAAALPFASAPLRSLLQTRHFQKAKLNEKTYAPGATIRLNEIGNSADPLSLGAASAINQSNFSVNNPLGLDQQ